MGSYRGIHYKQLVDHFAWFSKEQRQALAKRYAARSPDPSDLAASWLEDPQRVVEVAEDALQDEESWQLLEELIFEHDITIAIEWAAKKTRRNLTALGLLKPSKNREHEVENSVPAAVAAIFSPEIPGTKTTLPMLLADLDAEALEAMARRYDLEPGESDVATVLALAEKLADSATFEELAYLLPDPECFGAALMILELGGVCFWQEVFGHEIGGPSGADNVLPLMRSEERDWERQIAELLTDWGVIFRIEDERAPLVVVPEELWPSLWKLGRNWLMDWAAACWDALAEQGTRQSEQLQRIDYQMALKWLVCEAEEKSLHYEQAQPTSDSLHYLVEVGGQDSDFWRDRLELALELSAVRVRRNGEVQANPAFKKVLDLPRASFVRQVLFDWCTGYVGRRADVRLPGAIGLDDVWREHACELLRGKREFVPVWMEHEGIKPELTGAGCLRNTQDTPPESLMVEVGLLNGLVWSAKLVWLDLLSVLESDFWYPLAELTELLQLSCAFSVFSQILHVLEQPQMNYYLPVQRASFLTDPYHTSEFDAWIQGIIEHLLGPLGVARLSEDGQRVWLDAASLRIESPPGLADEERTQLIREILQDPTLDFRIPHLRVSRLHKVTEPPDGDHIELDAPVDVIRRWIKGRRVVSFDGRHLTAQSDA